MTACFVASGFIVFDMITGIISAFKKRKFTSSKMRQGLFHKCGSLLMIVFGVLIDVAQTYIDIGFSCPFAIPICVYIILMEIGSIYENLGQINPELKSKKISQYFSKLNGEE